MEGAVFAERDHVVNILAHSLGPRQRGHDAPVTDDLKPKPSPCGQRKSYVSTRGCGNTGGRGRVVRAQDIPVHRGMLSPRMGTTLHVSSKVSHFKAQGDIGVPSKMANNLPRGNDLAPKMSRHLRGESSQQSLTLVRGQA